MKPDELEKWKDRCRKLWAEMKPAPVAWENCWGSNFHSEEAKRNWFAAMPSEPDSPDWEFAVIVEVPLGVPGTYWSGSD